MKTDAERIVDQLRMQITHINAQPTFEGLCEKYGEGAVYAAAHRMETRGGSFAACIAKAFYHADLSNRRKLFSAFGDLFESFIEEEVNRKNNNE